MAVATFRNRISSTRMPTLLLVWILLGTAVPPLFGTTRTYFCQASSQQQQDSSKRNALEASKYIHIPPNCFAPNGKLYSIEHVMQAIESPSDASSNTVIAISCSQGVVIISTLPPSPYSGVGHKSSTKKQPNESEKTDTAEDDAALQSKQPPLSLWLDIDEIGLTPTAVPPFARLSPSIFAVTAGNAVDGVVLRNKMLHWIQTLWERQGEDDADHLDLWYVARKIADQRQRPTQQPFKEGRVLASTAVVWDNNKNGDLYRIDPTGQFWKCQVVVSGRGARAVESAFVDRLLGSGDDDNDGVKEKQTRPPKSVGSFTQRTARQLQNRMKEVSLEEVLVMARDCLILQYSKLCGNNRFARELLTNNQIQLRAVVLSNSSEPRRSIRYLSSSQLMKLGQKSAS